MVDLGDLVARKELEEAFKAESDDEDDDDDDGSAAASSSDGTSNDSRKRSDTPFLYFARFLDK